MEHLRHFKIYSKQEILSATRIRRFETKLGEAIKCIQHDVAKAPEESLQQALDTNSATYIVFGIAEDIGVRANYGKGGTDTLWQTFMTSFLNLQSNDFMSGENVLLLGHFDFSDLRILIEQNAHDEDEKVLAYRHAVLTVDDEVEYLTKMITSAGKIPVAIGGGHNNAYPLIKGSAKGLNKSGKLPLAQINAMNLDAHSDYRTTEGRHSGNGFRYAEEDGYLQKYCIIGLQEGLIPQNVWVDIVNNPFIDFVSFEDIFIHEKRTFMQAVAHACAFTDDAFTGIELDLDAIQNTLSSAETPTGIQTVHARQYINYAAADSKVAYLHICEGAAILADGRKQETIGKLVAHLVCDFIKSRDSINAGQQ